MIQYFNKLAAAGFFPHPVSHVDVCETRTAFVFLTGQRAYKMKKSVRIDGLLDFTAPADRGRYLREEMRINKVFGHDLYREVVPVFIDESGLPSGTGSGEPAEYLLIMKEIPQENLLINRLLAKKLFPEQDAQRLAAVVHRFHTSASPVDDPNLLSLKRQLELNVRGFARAVNVEGADAFVDRVERFVHYNRRRLEQRARQGKVRDIHGDLRSDNIFFVGGSFYIFDRVEYDKTLRYQDVAYDVGTFVADLLAFGLEKEANAFVNHYIASSGDHELRELLPLYIAIRSALNVVIQVELVAVAATEEMRSHHQYLHNRYMEVALCSGIFPKKHATHLRIGR